MFIPFRSFLRECTVKAVFRGPNGNKKPLKSFISGSYVALDGETNCVYLKGR